MASRKAMSHEICLERWIDSTFPCYIPFVSTICFVGDGVLVNGTSAVTMGAVATEGKVLTTFSLVTGSVLITGFVVACDLAVTAALLTGASGIGITNNNQCTEGITDEIQHVFRIIQFILKRAISGEINKLLYVQLRKKQMQNLVLCIASRSVKFRYGFCVGIIPINLYGHAT